MEQAFAVSVGDGAHARAMRVGSFEELVCAARELGLEERAVLVVVGGADRMSRLELRRLRPLFGEVLAPLAQRLRATVIDGGTDTGVMRLMGEARTGGGHSFPLVGVIVELLAAHADREPLADAADLEPNHTHFVLVPGTQWGEEAPWIARLASAVAGRSRSVTLLVNGGPVAWEDVRHSVELGRPVLVLEGSGRTADALSAGVRGANSDRRTSSLVQSGLVHAVAARDGDGLARLLDDLLSGRV